MKKDPTTGRFLKTGPIKSIRDIHLICEVCSKTFHPIYTWKSSYPKTCSKECLSIYRSKQMIGRIVSRETREKISRKNSGRKYSHEFTLTLSERMKRLAEERRGKPRPSINHNYTDKCKKHCEKLGKMGAEYVRNRVKSDPKWMAGVENRSCKNWSIRSPIGIVYHFVNARVFFEENTRLFKDTTLKSFLSGVSSLRPTSRAKKPIGSWRGWTWYSALEDRLNNGHDLLNRNLIAGASPASVTK